MVLRKLLSANISHFRIPIRRKSCLSNLSAMQNAYIRFPSGSETFSLTFHYVNESLGVNRQFNMKRQLSESVSALLTRIQFNVQKIALEAHKKKRRKIEKKKKAEETGSDDDYHFGPEPQITVELLKRGNQVLSDQTCQALLETNDLLTLSLTGKKFHIVLNPPWIDDIQLPKSILCNFPVYPSKFIGSSLDPAQSVYEWYKQPKNSKVWEKVGTGYMYTPSVADINHILKLTCEPKRESISGPVAEAVSKVTVEAGPGECPFELRHAFTKERATGNSFRVMTYNILAGLYSDTDTAKNELFSHCPTYALDIDYRKQLLIKEILGYNTDVMCLQEVDEKVFENDLRPILSLQGYTGVFHKKGNSVSEGIACFVNTNRFRLVSTHLSVLAAELNERQCFQKLWEAVKNNERLLERLKDKATSSQASILQSIENPNKWLVVGNTHLYYHPDADHVRLLQGGQTILFIDEMVKKVQNDNPGADVSVLLCGDFNSTPECGIFRLMTTGSAPEDLVDWKSNENEQIVGLSLSQPFSLASACGTPKYTNYTVGFADCLDYIFYETRTLQVKEVIPLYSDEELQRHTALPNVVFPSDHVALVSDLQWTNPE